MRKFFLFLLISSSLASDSSPKPQRVLTKLSSSRNIFDGVPDFHSAGTTSEGSPFRRLIDSRQIEPFISYMLFEPRYLPSDSDIEYLIQSKWWQGVDEVFAQIGTPSRINRAFAYCVLRNDLIMAEKFIGMGAKDDELMVSNTAVVSGNFKVIEFLIRHKVLRLSVKTLSNALQPKDGSTQAERDSLFFYLLKQFPVPDYKILHCAFISNRPDIFQAYEKGNNILDIKIPEMMNYIIWLSKFKNFSGPEGPNELLEMAYKLDNYNAFDAIIEFFKITPNKSHAINCYKYHSISIFAKSLGAKPDCIQLITAEHTAFIQAIAALRGEDSMYRMIAFFIQHDNATLFKFLFDSGLLPPNVPYIEYAKEKEANTILNDILLNVSNMRIIYENQRWWGPMSWNSDIFRAEWTDERGSSVKFTSSKADWIAEWIVSKEDTTDSEGWEYGNIIWEDWRADSKQKVTRRRRWVKQEAPIGLKEELLRGKKHLKVTKVKE